jgi:hypothetical protein
VKISEAESRLAELREEHGDLDLLITYGEGTYSVTKHDLTHEVSEGQYPEDWEMPEGFEFIDLMVDR